MQGIYKYLIGITSVLILAAAVYSLVIRPITKSENIADYFTGSDQARSFGIRDIDGDGNDEVFIYNLDPRGAYIKFVDQDLNPIQQETLPDRDYNKVLSWADTDGDGTLEMGIPYRIPDSIIIQFYKIKEYDIRPSARIAFPQGKSEQYPGYWDGFYRAIAMIDADDDGRDEIIFHVHTNYNYQPRALFAYDPANEKILWHYPFGTAIGYFNIGDFNDDGYAEILMGSHAFTNGPPEGVNGTDDFHSYLIMLDRKGNLLLQKELGGKYSWCSVAGLPYDTRFPGNLYASVFPSAPDETDSRYRFGRIVTVDPETHDIVKESILGQESKAFQKIYDPLDKLNRQSGIITSGNDGRLRIYDWDLTLRHESRQYVGMNSKIIDDVNDDGYLETIIITDDNHLRLLDNFMIEFAGYDVSHEEIGLVSVIHRDNPDHCRIITQTTNIKVFRIPEVPDARMAQVYVWVSSNYLTIAVAYVCAISLLIIGWIVRLLLLQNAISVKVNELSVPSASGVMCIDNGKCVLYADNNAQSMIALPSRWRRISLISIFGPKAGNEFIRVLDKLRDVQKTATRLTLPLVTREGIRIVGLQFAGKVPAFRANIYLYIVDAADPKEAEELLLDWFDLSSSLMHGIKSPMTNILRSVELTRELLPSVRSEKNIAVTDELNNAVHYIRQSIDIADQFLQFRLKRVNKDYYVAEDLIQDAVDYTIIPLGIPVDCAVNVENPQLNLYTDRELFRQLLSILIHNAADAVDRDHGSIIIQCRSARNMQIRLPVEFDESYDVILVVEDDGRGISEDVLHRIFEPFYTTKIEKGGHGLGLAIARKLCNMLNLQIAIESSLGKGTRAFIGFCKDGDERYV